MVSVVSVVSVAAASGLDPPACSAIASASVEQSVNVAVAMPVVQPTRDVVPDEVAYGSSQRQTAWATLQC